MAAVRSLLAGRGVRSAGRGPQQASRAMASRAVQRAIAPRAPHASLRGSAVRRSALRSAAGGGRGRRTSSTRCQAEEQEQEGGQLGLKFQPAGSVRLDSSDLELCMLPFPLEEIFLPGMEKELHLYEARYIRLLEDVAARSDNMFLHTVVLAPWEKGSETPVETPGSFSGQDFALSFNTIVQLVSVERQEFGAVITIRGEGRAGISHLTSTYPYISGFIQPLLDIAPGSRSEATAEKADALEGLIKNIMELGEKLGQADSEEQMEMERAMKWVSADTDIRFSMSFDGALDKASRLSYAALLDVPTGSGMDKAKLIQARMAAMKTQYTDNRLDIGLDVMSEMRATMAAKVALRALSL